MNYTILGFAVINGKDCQLYIGDDKLLYKAEKIGEQQLENYNCCCSKHNIYGKIEKLSQNEEKQFTSFNI